MVSYPGLMFMETEYVLCVESAILVTDIHQVFHERATVTTVVGCTMDWILSLIVSIEKGTSTCTYMCIYTICILEYALTLAMTQIQYLSHIFIANSGRFQLKNFLDNLKVASRAGKVQGHVPLTVLTLDNIAALVNQQLYHPVHI